MDKLPLIELILDEEAEGLSAIALVDQPAIGLKGYTFNEQQQEYHFEVVDEEKRIVLAAAMIPDLPIYRRDERGEYQVIFRKETIAKLVEKFNREKKTDQFNIMHNGELINGVFIRDSFITSEEMGIVAPKQWKNVADGTWFVTAKIEDDATWEQVKTNGLIGFSVEGMFKEKEFSFTRNDDGSYIIEKSHTMKKPNQNVLAKFAQGLKDLADKFSQSNESQDETIERFEAKIVKFNDQALAEDEEVKMGEATLADGTIIAWEGDLEIGTAIKIVTPDGELSAEDGQWELEDGMIVVTEGGLVAEILEAPIEDEFDQEELNALIEALENGIFEKVEAKINEKFDEVSAKIEEVKEEFTSKNEENTSNFKQQLEEKFNEVVKTFKDGTQELLQIFDEDTDSFVEPDAPVGESKLSKEEKYENFKSILSQMVPKNTLEKLEKTNARARKNKEYLN